MEADLSIFLVCFGLVLTRDLTGGVVEVNIFRVYPLEILLSQHQLANQTLCSYLLDGSGNKTYYNRTGITES